MKSYINEVIDLANNYTKELVLLPFAYSYRKCTNDCSFCLLHLQNKEMLSLTLSEFKEISNNVIQFLLDNISLLNNDVRIILSIVGGELYNLSKEYYDIYKYLILECSKICKDNNKLFTIALFSNLLYEDEHIKKLIDLIEFCKKETNEIEVLTSFDLSGRFKNSDDLNTWYNHYLILSKIVKINVNVLLTASNCEKYLVDCNETLLFNKVLKDNTHITFNQFMATEDTIKEIPTKDQIIRLFKEIIDRYYPNLPNVSIFSYKNSIENYDKINFSVSKYCYALRFTVPRVWKYYNEKDNIKLDTTYNILKTYCLFFTSPIINEDIKIEFNKFMEDTGTNSFFCSSLIKKGEFYRLNKYGCASCKYIKICNSQARSLRNNYCYIHYFLDQYCWLKDVFDYLDKKENSDLY